MRILVDPSVFRYGRCGLTRYYGSVCSGLQSLGHEVHIPLLSSNCDFRPGFARYTWPLRRIKKLRSLLDRFSEVLFRQAVKRGRFDVVLLTSPAFDAAFLRSAPATRYVMVVHDLMSCVTAPDGLYDAAGPGLTALLYLARRAARIICISNDTRNALLQQEVIDPARVAVVHTGNLLAETNALESTLPMLPEHFVLFVGERSGRKGFYQAVRALAPLFAKDADLHLVCTGLLRQAEEDYIGQYLPLPRVRCFAADDQALVHLYKNAICLLYPSLYEGFGLPVIEAMHLGCPVITTGCGALHEIAGEAALMVNPYDLEEMTRGIRLVLNDGNVRDQLRSKGFLNAERFSTQQMMRNFEAEISAVVSS